MHSGYTNHNAQNIHKTLTHKNEWWMQVWPDSAFTFQSLFYYYRDLAFNGTDLLVSQMLTKRKY